MSRRSALLAGLVVLLVLLAGQVVGSWQRRPVFRVATVSNDRPLPPPPEPGARAEPGVRPSPPPEGSRRTAPPRRPSLAALGVRQVTGSSGVALTFDDGPDPVHTPRILATLRASKVRAVFCVVGTEVSRFPRLAAQIAGEGHTLCNHSWDHDFGLGTRPPTRIREDLSRTNAAIRRAVPGAKIRYFRHPGGMWTAAAVKAARQLGMVPLGWSVDPRDWEDHPAGTIKQRVLAQARPGSVILLHDAGGDRSATVSACQSLIPALKRRHRLIPLR